MAIEIRPFTPDLVPLVEAFNARLQEGGAPPVDRFPESPVPRWLPKIDNRRIYQDIYLALENGSVRGGYLLKHQDFSFCGEIRSVGLFRWLLSEGIVNRKYAWVALEMLRSANKAQPLLHGWASDALLRLLTLFGWGIREVEFYFKVNRPSRFLKEIPRLRKTTTGRLLLDFAAATGTGTIAIKAMHGVLTKRGERNVSVEPVGEFTDWADQLWNESKDRYAMVAVRDSETLKILYPSDSERFLCYRVLRGNSLVGWAVLLDTQMSNDKHFGNMKVGSIVDCLAAPENASIVTRAVTRVLEERGVDLIISNQSHAAWGAALRDAGFLRGPSALRFAASKGLVALLQPFPEKMVEVHYNRGDGEGPGHL